MANTITTKIDINASEAVKALKGVEDGLEGAGTAAQQAAALIRANADKLVADFRAQENAVDKVSAALGVDFVAEVERSGKSVQELVVGLHRAGVGFDDMAAHADELAASLKHAEAAGRDLGAHVSGGGNVAADGLARVAREGDNSRSVLANMVGNSVQDLGALGGVAGTAGMALGQLAEYATEGNISMAGIAATAGPLVAVAAAGWGISAAMEASARNAAEAKRETELLGQVQAALAAGNIPEAVNTLATEYADTIPILEQYGMGARDLLNTLDGSTVAIDAVSAAAADLRDRYVEASATGADNADSLKEQWMEAEALARTLTEARDRSAAAAEAARVHAENIDKLNGALYENVDTTKRGADAADRYGEATANAAASMGVFSSGASQGIAKMIQWVQAADNVPGNVKTELNAAINRNDWAAINAILNQWAGGVTIPVSISTTVGSAQSILGGAAASYNKSFKGRFTLPNVGGGGGGGGGGSSGGGGGGGGGSSKTDDPMAEWDAAMKRAREYNEITLDEYRDYLTGRLGAYDRYSDEYFTIWQGIQSLDKEEADAKKKAADEEKKALDEREKADKEQAKRDEEKIQRQQEIAAMFEAARSAAAETFNNGPRSITIYTAGGGEEVVQAIKAYERNNGTGWRS